MSLRLPSEIVADRFVPTLRVMLASELDKKGLTQQEIADYIGVSQPAVSKYVSGSVRMEERFSEDLRMVETVENVADGLAEGEMTEFEALAEVIGLIRAFEDRGPICEVHEEIMPSLQGMGCDLCVRGLDSDVLREREVLSNVRKASRTLANTPGMAKHIPNVGTNIGYSLPDPKNVTDVAAIPGRIYAMRGRINIPANPEFGASQHVAEMIIAANSLDDEIRGAINLSMSESLLDGARKKGYDPLEFDADYEDRESRLKKLFRERGDVPRVIYHRGSFGIEPITYVFGRNAVEAAELAAELVGVESE
ncbi:MAG: thiamine-phosphate synthase family protein [Halobacteria archaeon]|nr:thiamine-phosphate synthase family protein [Halobacteria archaeon]